MKQIDRLLVKADGSDKTWYCLAFIQQNNDGYDTRYSFWDSRPRGGRKRHGGGLYDTLGDARAAIDNAVAAFPFRLGECTVIVDDIESKVELCRSD